MIKRIDFIVFIFVTFTSSVVAQKVERIFLKASPSYRMSTDFYIEKVEDHRMDTSIVGNVRKGLAKKKRTVELGNSFTGEIFDFLEETITKEESKRPLRLLVHKLWILEKATRNTEIGVLELTIELQEKKAGTFVSLGFYEQSRRIKGFNVTKLHDENIREGLIACLEDFKSTNSQDSLDRFSERLSFNNGIPRKLKKGFYNSFADLLNNNGVKLKYEENEKSINDLVARYFFYK